MKKFLRFWVAVLPPVVLMGIQMAVSFLFMILMMIRLVLEHNVDVLRSPDMLLTMFMKDTMKVYVVYAILSLIVLGAWYFFAFVRKKASLNPMKCLSLKSVFAVLLGTIGLFFFTQGFMSMVDLIAPSLIESYTSTIEASGIAEMTLISSLCAIVLAPIVEEITVRGLSVKLLKWAGFGFWGVLIWQAVFFGVMHMQLLQSTYTFFFGLFLGYIAIRYNSIYISILCHICYNTCGTVISAALESLNLPNLAWVILGVLGAALMVPAIILVEKDKKKVPFDDASNSLKAAAIENQAGAVQ